MCVVVVSLCVFSLPVQHNVSQFNSIMVLGSFLAGNHHHSFSISVLLLIIIFIIIINIITIMMMFSGVSVSFVNILCIISELMCFFVSLSQTKD